MKTTYLNAPTKSLINRVLVSLCFAGGTVSAQPQLWDIYSTADQPFVNVVVDKYQSDSLYMKSATQLFVLHQDSIRYLVKENKSKFGTGFLIGALVGYVFMNSLPHSSDGLFSGLEEVGRSLSSALGVLFGGLIGGAIGVAQGIDTKYQLDELDTEAKRKLLNQLFPKAEYCATE